MGKERGFKFKENAERISRRTRKLEQVRPEDVEDFKQALAKMRGTKTIVAPATEEDNYDLVTDLADACPIAAEELACLSCCSGDSAKVLDAYLGAEVEINERDPLY